MRLCILHPEVAWRDCGSCQEFEYDDAGTIVIGRDGKPSKRSKGCFPPCRYTHKGCPKGTPEDQRSLTPLNQQVFDHYRECRAVGEFPDDALVRRHAALISEIESACYRQMDRDRLYEFVLLARV